jgi:hypothetical protein
MAAPKANERREPVFDGAPASDSRAEAPTPRRPKPADGGNRPKRKRRSRKRGGGRRWTVGRVIYWGAVVGLWLVIATIGGAVWVGVGDGLAVMVWVGLGPGVDLPDFDGDGEGDGEGDGAIFEYLPFHGFHSGMIAGTAKSGMYVEPNTAL